MIHLLFSIKREPPLHQKPEYEMRNEALAEQQKSVDELTEELECVILSVGGYS